MIIQRKRIELYRWWQLIYFFGIFHPENWGRWTHFDYRIFFRWVGEKAPSRLPTLTFWKSLRRVPGRVAGTCFQSRLEAQKKTIEGKGRYRKFVEVRCATNKEKLDVDEPRFCFDSQSHFYIFLQASPLLGVCCCFKKFRVHKLSTWRWVFQSKVFFLNVFVSWCESAVGSEQFSLKFRELLLYIQLQSDEFHGIYIHLCLGCLCCLCQQFGHCNMNGITVSSAVLMPVVRSLDLFSPNPFKPGRKGCWVIL